jgi:hypothetical protein
MVGSPAGSSGENNCEWLPFAVPKFWCIKIRAKTHKKLVERVDMLMKFTT